MKRRSNDTRNHTTTTRPGAQAWRYAPTIAFTLALLVATFWPLRVSFAEAVNFAALLPRPSIEALLVWPDQGGASQTTLTLQEQEQLVQQRERIDEMARSRLGRSLSGTRADLTTVQRLLDEGALEKRDRYRLQALGVVLGNVMVSEHGYEWIAYHDELGRSRALRHPETERIVFPVTAISRRVEAGLEVDVRELFDRLEAGGNPGSDRQFASSHLDDPR